MKFLKILFLFSTVSLASSYGGGTGLGGTGAAIGDVISGATTGSVLFVGPGSTLAQDNANFFWDDTNNWLGIGTATPSVAIDLTGSVRIRSLSSAGVCHNDTSGNISSSLVVNADVSASAAIAYSKLALTGSIVNADVASGAAIVRTKLASGTAFRILANDTSGVMAENAALTASRVISSDANGQLQASSVTTTTLAFLDATSSIQTQLNAKQASGNYITALTGDVAAAGPGSVAATLATVNSNVGSFTYGAFTVNAKGLITAASSGTAPVTSVTLSVPGSSILGVTGSPVTTTGTLGLTTTGTSGGIPYFSSSSVLSTSTALTSHGVVIGGGAGTAPTSTAAGTSGQVLTSNGASADPTYQAAAAPVTVGFSATGATTAVTNGSTTTLVNGTEDFDTDSAYDNTTGIFTAPSTGKYVCSAAYASNAAAVITINAAVTLSFNKNAGSASWNPICRLQSTGTYRVNCIATSPAISLTSGDTMRLDLMNASGQTLTGESSTGNYFSCWKVGT